MGQNAAIRACDPWEHAWNLLHTMQSCRPCMDTALIKAFLLLSERQLECRNSPDRCSFNAGLDSLGMHWRMCMNGLVSNLCYMV